MKAHDPLALCLAATLWVTLPVPSSAQAKGEVALDLAFKTRYEWRGVTRNSGAVLQPDLAGSWRIGPTRATVGAWTNIGLDGVATGGTGIGLPRRWLGETNVWAEWTGSLHDALDLTAGWAAYRFRTPPSGLASPTLPNTSELYLKSELTLSSTLVPAFAAWYDVGPVKGGYFEGSLRFRIPVWANTVIPAGSIFLTALAGLNAGQSFNPARPNDAFYFASSGLTHIDLSAATTIGYVPIGPIQTAIHLELHHQRNHDQLTRRADLTTGGADRRAKTWFGISLSVLMPRCQPERALCGI